MTEEDIQACTRRAFQQNEELVHQLAERIHELESDCSREALKLRLDRLESLVPSNSAACSGHQPDGSAAAEAAHDPHDLPDVNHGAQEGHMQKLMKVDHRPQLASTGAAGSCDVETLRAQHRLQRLAAKQQRRDERLRWPKQEGG